MAYVSHSSFDYGTLREQLAHAPASLLIRSGVVAAAAAIAVLALSEANLPAADLGAVKGDRIAAARPAAPVEGARAIVDAQARTTTVERGAAIALAPDSPMRALN